MESGLNKRTASSPRRQVVTGTVDKPNETALTQRLNEFERFKGFNNDYARVEMLKLKQKELNEKLNAKRMPEAKFNINPELAQNLENSHDTAGIFNSRV